MCYDIRYISSNKNEMGMKEMDMTESVYEREKAKLNASQREAVETTEGYVRVIAGAGSGKTKALTQRYMYLVQELGISTANLLCVTFTNKAANEMKRRIRSGIGDQDTALICTFHGFGVQLLREDIHTLQYPDDFLVLDEEDAETLLRHVYETAKISSSKYTYSMAKTLIGERKQDLGYIESFRELDIAPLRQQYEQAQTTEDKIFFGYLYEQRKCYGLDFDDLIYMTLYILQHYEEKRQKWQERLEYIMVDEFQDVSARQYELVSILSGYHQNLFIVGDPDQTIYTWRGARVEYILNFDKIYPEAHTIFMNENYRSLTDILQVSNSLIEKNQKRVEKRLQPVRSGDQPVLYFHAKTLQEEAGWMVGEIRKLLAKGVTHEQIAVLYRAHAVSRSVEEAFIREKLPYVLYSGIAFYQRREIKDMICYLRMLVMGDDWSFLRIINEPKRNFGEKRLKILQDYAEQQGVSLYAALRANLEQPLIAKSKAADFVTLIEKYRKCYKEMRITDVLAGILSDSGYEAMLRSSGDDERLDNLSELRQAVYEYEAKAVEEHGLEDYLQRIALFTTMDRAERKGTIKLMTIHTAKGLEFPYVFVCGMNEGIFPSKHVCTLDQLEEERRLAYVAFTRAENALYLSDAEGVSHDGGYRFPSRFILNVDKAYLHYVVPLDDQLADQTLQHIAANERIFTALEHPAFTVGDIVEHRLLGRGTVQAVDTEHSCYKIRFEGKNTVRTISMTMKMERVAAGGE